MLLPGLGLNTSGAQTSSVTFQVNSAADATDARPGDGICATVGRRCTLRAAIQEANALPAHQTIKLPAGTYKLGIPPLNENDIRTGDLNITGALTIAGAGAATTIVDGGAPAPTSAYTSAVLRTSGLAAYWRLGEATGTTAADRLGAYPGTFRGGFTLGQPGGITNDANTAVRFDGFSGEMTAGGPRPSSSASIEGWFNWISGPTLMRDHGGGWILAYDSAGHLNYRVAGVTYSTGITTASLRGGWHHVVLTKTGSNVAFYIDGHQVHSASGAPNTAPVTPWHLMRNGNHSQFSAGRADEVAVYSSALSAATVQQHYSLGSQPEIPGLDRLFSVGPSAGTVQFSGLTIREGHAGGDGGAVLNEGSASVSVANSTIKDNFATGSGGGIENHAGGTVRVTDSRLTSNFATGSGSAANNNRAGLLDIRRSSVSNNGDAPAGAGGSAIENTGELDTEGTVVVADSRVSYNPGGAIRNAGAGGLIVARSVISLNGAGDEGAAGGISNHSGALTVRDSTLTGNFADYGAAIDNDGAIALDKTHGAVTIERSIIASNAAAADGGGLHNGFEGSFKVIDSRISGNTAGAEGGGVANSDKGSVSLAGTTISGNRAISGGGFNHGGDGPATVTDTELTGNSAQEDGGGLHVDSDGQLTVTGGLIADNKAGRDGGGLHNAGDGVLTVRGTELARNAAQMDGGGVLIDSGAVRISDSTITANTAGQHGGGLSNRGDAAPVVGPTATLARVTVTNNTAKAEGGGVETRSDGTFEIRESTIAGNRALNGGGLAGGFDGATTVRTTRIRANAAVPQGSVGGEGGGVVYRGDAQLLIDRSSLDRNQARHGGGLFVGGDVPVEVENSTFYENTAAIFGGGVFVDSAVDFHDTTLSRNSAPFGGNINNGAGSYSGGIVSLLNSIVANALAPVGHTAEDCMGPVLSQGGNMDRGDSCRLRGVGDIIRTDPKLKPYAYNGGPTPTLALDPTSRAIDTAGGGALCPPIDQRAVPRPDGRGCDRGAYELDGDNPCLIPPQIARANADAWIEQNSPLKNNGIDGSLKVRSLSGSSNLRTLVRFALPSVPQGCRVTGGKLLMYAASATSGRTLQALALTSAWTESGVTWANRPTTTGVATTAASRFGWIEWSVRAADLQSMYNGANHGFLIKDAAESGSGAEQQFNSREKAPDPTPVLLVTISP
jgi:CSLREA domain-containing protein